MNGNHTFADSFLYEQCDVPPGKSLREWRRSAACASPRPRRTSLMARLHLGPRRTLTPAR